LQVLVEGRRIMAVDDVDDVDVDAADAADAERGRGREQSSFITTRSRSMAEPPGEPPGVMGSVEEREEREEREEAQRTKECSNGLRV
jgi:hypothetical protein